MSLTTVKSQDELFSLFDKVRFFNVFTEYERKVLAAVQSNFIHFNTDEEITVKGEPSDSFYVVLSGEVAVVKYDVPIASLGPSEMVGEMAFFKNTQRTATTIATQPTLTLRVTRDVMQNLNSTLREKIKNWCVLGLVERIHKTEQRIQVRRAA